MKALAYSLLISGLRVMGSVGLLPNERVAEQPLVIDLELFLETTNVDQGRVLKVDYAQVADFVQQFCCLGHIDLIEDFAFQLAGFLFTHFGDLSGLELRVAKPLALEKADYAGVVLKVSRKEIV